MYSRDERVRAGLVLLLVAAGAALRFQHLNDVVSRTPDERVYTYYAHRIAEMDWENSLLWSGNTTGRGRRG